MDNEKGTTLPPGATLVKDAGRPADAPGLLAEKGTVDTKPKRNLAAAGELPQLYKDLAAARETLASLEAGRLDVHTIQMDIGGTPSTYHPADREAVGAAVKADMQAKVSRTEARIKELGFDVE
jgi:hypothetical protein